MKLGVLLTDQLQVVDWQQTVSALGFSPSGWFFCFGPQISLEKMGNTMNSKRALHLGVFYLRTEALSPSPHSLHGLWCVGDHVIRQGFAEDFGFVVQTMCFAGLHFKLCDRLTNSLFVSQPGVPSC